MRGIFDTGDPEKRTGGIGCPALGYDHGGYGGGGGSGDSAAAGIVLLIVVLMAVMCVLIVWASIRGIDLVIRAWRQCKGKSNALRITLFTWIGLALVAGGFGAAVATRTIVLNPQVSVKILAVLGSLLGLSTVVLLITARITELKYRFLFAAEPETLVTKVLRRPWWTSSERQAS